MNFNYVTSWFWHNTSRSHSKGKNPPTIGRLPTQLNVQRRTDQIAEGALRQPALSPDVAPLVAPGSSSWTPRSLDMTESLGKMYKNAQKAVGEHIEVEEPKSQGDLATIEEALPPIDDLQKVKDQPLSFTHSVREEQSKRETMEDAHFYVELENGVLAGIMDGHGGSEVSKYASAQFKERFPETLGRFNGDVYQAFEHLIHDIHKEVAKHEAWNSQGTTAAISFIDKRTHLIYTATVADSEAKIYRNIENQVKSIPLSPIRNWASTKEAIRAAIALNCPNIVMMWPLDISGAKHRRVGRLNISRSIGDADHTLVNDHPAVIHKPKISVNQLKPGDTVIIACDGLWDFVSEKEMVTQIKSHQENPAQNQDLANVIVDISLKNQEIGGGDNVSVIAIQIS
jgi:serine/threonine protein phosphatase PrpC